MNIQISIRKTIAIVALLLIVCAGLGHSDDSIYAQQSPVDATDPTNGNGTLLLPIIISGNNTDNEVDQGSGDTPSDQVSDDDQSPEEPDNNPYLSTEHDDVYWAEQTADQEPFVVTEEMLQAAAANNVGGQWGSVIQWPHTPVSIANLPNGKIMTFSGSERRSWPDREQTYSAVWDPSNNSFDEIFNNNHNMFCADMVSMDDGRILVNGGRNTVSFASIFDPFTNSWSRTDNMNDERWYPTSVPLPDGRVFTAVGQNNRYPEVWTDGQGWRRLTGADLQGAILNYGSGRDGAGWWPLMHLDPRGKILHYGATPYMHSIDPNGNGSVNGLGRHNLNWFPEESVAIQFDENRILIAGGANDINQEESATNRAAILDMSNAQPNVYTINSMHYARQHANEVVLPDGQVLVIGGTTSGQKFSDNGSVMTPELWNPATGQWRDMNNMAVPRNYHSTALLLTDGRVLSAGGGYHWDDGNHFSNHPDGQVFSPPYLFNNFGSPAQRPQILQAPTLAGVGSTFSVSTSEAISRFTMVRMSATTHTMKTTRTFCCLATGCSLR